jgi:flagella basal body P-ring formation protein FlgA
MIRIVINLMLALAAVATAGVKPAWAQTASAGSGGREVWIASRHTRPVRIELRAELVLQVPADAAATVRLRDIARISAADDLRLGEAADTTVLTLLPADQRAAVDADLVRRALFNHGWEAHQVVVEGSRATEVSRGLLREDGLRSATNKTAAASPEISYPISKGTRAALARPVSPARMADGELRSPRKVPAGEELTEFATELTPTASDGAADRQSVDELKTGDEPEASLGPAAPDADSDMTPTADETSAVRPAEQEKQQMLREILSAQASAALNLPPGQTVVQWQEADSRYLSLRGVEGGLFDIKPVRLRTLGQATWEVTLRSPGQKARKLPITGTVRAWQNQIVAVRPLAQGAVIAAGDVNVRRQLVDQLMPELELTRDQVIGMQATRDIDVGKPISARVLQQIPLAKTGQTINVQVSSGAIRVNQTLRALEGGGLGQTVRARNDETRQTFSVRLTGAQQGVLAETASESSSD